MKSKNRLNRSNAFHSYLGEKYDNLVAKTKPGSKKNKIALVKSEYHFRIFGAQQASNRIMPLTQRIRVYRSCLNEIKNN